MGFDTHSTLHIPTPKIHILKTNGNAEAYGPSRNVIGRLVHAWQEGWLQRDVKMQPIPNQILSMRGCEMMMLMLLCINQLSPAVCHWFVYTAKCYL